MYRHSTTTPLRWDPTLQQTSQTTVQQSSGTTGTLPTNGGHFQERVAKAEEIKLTPRDDTTARSPAIKFGQTGGTHSVPFDEPVKSFFVI